MKNSRAMVTLAASLLAVTSVSACSSDSASGAGSSEGTVITIGTLKGQPHLYAPYFYEENAPEGVTFEVVTFDSSPDIKNAVVSGSVDFGVAGVTSAISAASASQDIVLVAAAADGGTGLIGKAGLDGVESLKGLKVGYPKGSSQEIVLRTMLEEAGMDADTDVELVNLPYSDMAGALAAGRIDAFCSAELGVSTALQGDAVSVASPYETPVGKVNIGLYTTGTTIAEDPELVQDVVDTHIAATEQMLADPEAWAAGLVDTFGIDRAVTDTAITNIWLHWDMDAEYTGHLGALIEHMYDFKQIESEPDVAALVDTTFVEAHAAAATS